MSLHVLTYTARRTEKKFRGGKKATLNSIKFNYTLGASLVVQWLRIHLPMQGTWIRALVQEDPTCCGATKPMCQNN